MSNINNVLNCSYFFFYCSVMPVFKCLRYFCYGEFTNINSVHAFTVIVWYFVVLYVQVKNKSSAVLLSEIAQFVEPGTRIVSDALASYNKLPELGFQHDFVIHRKEFVKSDDRSVHTQNVEIRNRWTKHCIKSYRSNRSLNSYCSEYAYRCVKHNINALHNTFVYCLLLLFTALHNYRSYS